MQGSTSLVRYIQESPTDLRYMYDSLPSLRYTQEFLIDLRYVYESITSSRYSQESLGGPWHTQEPPARLSMPFSTLRLVYGALCSSLAAGNSRGAGTVAPISQGLRRITRDNNASLRTDLSRCSPASPAPLELMRWTA